MDVGLLCCETECECRAYPDPVLLKDERVLQNLLRSEERYAPSSSYFECVQKEITPEMRKIVAEWMLEVCVEQKCQEEVFPLAMNYVDRFLSVCAIRKYQLQLLGTTCLLLASKLREPRCLAVDNLVYYTDNSITRSDLWSWELLVLSKLKWDMSAVTPQDFLRHIIRRLPIDAAWNTDMVQRHAQTFIALCAREFKFSMYTPSMIAAASIAAALHGLGWTSKSGCSLSELLNRLHRITAIEQDYLQSCLHQIEDMITAAMKNRAIDGSVTGTSDGTGSETTASGAAEKIIEYEKAGTPTDVEDIHF